MTTKNPLLRNFSVDVLPKLENFVDQQIKDFSQYDKALNFHLLKLYQFHSQQSKPEYLAKTLTLAIAKLPQNDFQLALCLIPETMQKNPTLATVINLGRALEATKFREFWTLDQSSISSYSFFENEVRRFIIQVLDMTFKSLSKQELETYLNLKDQKSLENLLKDQKNWTLESDKVIIATSQKLKKREPVSDFSKILSVTRTH